MRNVPTTGTFDVKDITAAAVAEVIGEARTIPVQNARFTDSFAAYGSHTYRIR